MTLKQNMLISRFSLTILLTGALFSCQGPTPTEQTSPTPPPPTFSPSPTPSVPGKNPNGSINVGSIDQGCHGDVLICPKGNPCPVPSCLPNPFSTPEPTQQIDKSQYESLKTTYDFFAVNAAPEHLGSLTPLAPMAQGLKPQCSQSDGVVFMGGKLGSCVQYIVETEPSNYTLLKTKAEVTSQFAPIDSETEALSYAIAMTGDRPRFSFPELKPEFRYFETYFESSRAFKTDTGYTVNLYGFQQFGCGPHPHFMNTYEITTAGELNQTSSVKMYEDPALDSLCVD